jgi:hypothetical protein
MFTEYLNIFNIGTTTLGAGSYWLEMHNGPLTTTTWTNFAWEATSTVTTPSENLEAPFNGTWESNGAYVAFELSEVPEPSFLGLAGLGGLSLLALRRTR